MNTGASLLLIAVVFLCGFGWGKWLSERKIRKQRALMEVNKLFISIPVNKEDASQALGLLKDLIDKVQDERK
jgi:hypothetical protein